MRLASNTFHDRDFWLQFHERLQLLLPHFRIERCALIVSTLARGRECDLLDVGCGPANLAKLLPANIHYYGIDWAVQEQKPNLLELDIVENEIGFANKTFDIVVMAGVFEYIGSLQQKKMAEVQRILREDGKFIVTYLNFGHFEKRDNSPYNNIQTVQDFKRDLEMYFHLDRWFPTSHHWKRTEPRKEVMKRIQLPLGVALPIFSRKFAVSYLFICSHKY